MFSYFEKIKLKEAKLWVNDNIVPAVITGTRLNSNSVNIHNDSKYWFFVTEDGKIYSHCLCENNIAYSPSSYIAYKNGDVCGRPNDYQEVCKLTNSVYFDSCFADSRYKNLYTKIHFPSMPTKKQLKVIENINPEKWQFLTFNKHDYSPGNNGTVGGRIVPYATEILDSFLKHAFEEEHSEPHEYTHWFKKDGSSEILYCYDWY